MSPPSLPSTTPVSLAVQIGRLTLQNPVTVASGTFGYGVEYAQLLDLNQLGAVVVKGIRLGPVRGNPTPRTAEVTSGLLNAIGLQGPGVDGFITKYWPFLKALKVPTIINIWGTTVEEYAEVARRFDALGGVGALELNVSCPNIKEGGAQFGTDCRLLSQVVAACRQATALPLITKLSPNVVHIAPYARAAEEAGSDALAVTNSYPAMAIDVETRRPRLANVTGGLTGPCIKPIAIKLVWEAAQSSEDPHHRDGRHPERHRRRRVPHGRGDGGGRRHRQFLRAADGVAGHRRPARLHAAKGDSGRARSHRQRARGEVAGNLELAPSRVVQASSLPVDSWSQCALLWASPLPRRRFRHARVATPTNSSRLATWTQVATKPPDSRQPPPTSRIR